MSSMRQDDPDQERTQSDTSWTAASRPDEGYRLQMEVVAAASYLKRASKETDVEKPPTRLPSFNLAKPREDSFQLAETRRAWLQTLDPETMPPPPADQIKLPGFGTVTAVAAAIGVAAGIALAVTNTVRLPEPSSLLGGGEQASSTPASGTQASGTQASGAKTAAFSGSVLADFAQMQKAEARGQPADQRPSQQVFAAVQPTETDAAKSPMGVFAPLIRNEPAKSEVAPETKPEATQPAAPEQATAAPAPAAPRAAAASTLSRDEMATLFQRGRDLLNAGDIASARLILQHLAEAGNADASYALV
jgi:hypothetical protein